MRGIETRKAILHRRQEHGTQRSIRGTGGCGERRGDGGDHLYAKANLYGMGAGVFPKDKVPLLPAHPHCMCFLKPVIRGMIDNEMPIDRVEEGGREYLDSVSLHHRQMFLGIHGEKDVRAGESWTAKARGYSGAKLKGRFENIPVL